MIKKCAVILLVVCTCVILCGCYPKGSTKQATVHLGNSAVHSQEHLSQAANKVLAEFEKRFDGCTLTRLWYDESHSEKAGNGPHWKERYQADEVIVLLGDFHTRDYDANVLKTFSPDTTYTGFGWVVCRYGTEWVIEDGGYA